jgi:hypothetical protein
MHLRGKVYLVKNKGYHSKNAIQVKPSHLDHMSKMVAKFEEKQGHELG